MSGDFRFCPQCAAALATRTIDGFPRGCCPAAACGFVDWRNPVPVVAALVEWEGRIVLARNRDWPEKMFGLVTGFLEQGEAPDRAAAREVAEELGLRVRELDWLGHYPYPQQNQLLLAYHARVDGDLRLNEEIAEVRLVAPARLKPWDFGTGPAVADWLRRQGYVSSDSSPM